MAVQILAPKQDKDPLSSLSSALSLYNGLTDTFGSKDKPVEKPDPDLEKTPQQESPMARKMETLAPPSLPPIASASEIPGVNDALSRKLKRFSGY